LAVRDERAGLRGEYKIFLDEVSYLEVQQSQAETRTLSPT
jgi:hypothetical protein